MTSRLVPDTLRANALSIDADVASLTLEPFTRELTNAEKVTPAVAVSFDEGVATITLEPHTTELSEETKAAIVAVDMQRIFIDARGWKPGDYPQNTLAFLLSNATLVCTMDCSKPCAQAEIEVAHALFDARAEDSPWVVRIFTDCPGDWGDFVVKHRAVGQHCLAFPVYDAEPAAGLIGG
jgi:hypothetical protein